jgi:hypothetical protein
MPLQEAELHTFISKTEHQPSFIANAQRGINSVAASKQNDKPPHPRARHISGHEQHNKKVARATSKGFVKYGECANPRVIYPDTAPRRTVSAIVDGRIPTLDEDTMCPALAEEIFKEACISLTFVYGAMLCET